MKTLYIDRVTVSDYTYLIAVGDHGLAFVGSSNSEEELHHYIANAQLLKNSDKTNPYKTALKNLLLGKSQQFTLPIEFNGTPFQKSVWQALQTIPYGETTTYSALAEKLADQLLLERLPMPSEEIPIKSLFLVTASCTKMVQLAAITADYR